MFSNVSKTSLDNRWKLCLSVVMRRTICNEMRNYAGSEEWQELVNF